ncbi:MAG: hypothetical protein ACOCQD_01575 [archaeon]
MDNDTINLNDVCEGIFTLLITLGYTHISKDDDYLIHKEKPHIDEVGFYASDESKQLDAKLNPLLDTLFNGKEVINISDYINMVLQYDEEINFG